MARKPTEPTEDAETAAVKTPGAPSSDLQIVGGSRSDIWNRELVDQTVASLWLGYSEGDGKANKMDAAITGLIGIGPKDEIEGMIGAQLIAAHSAAMECYRRAMIPEQTFQGQKESLNQANKLSRTLTQLLEALNRHRGKGQQKVTVEHVHVHEGGQAIVGSVERGGRGGDES